MADHTHVMRDSFRLTGAVVNDYILTHTLKAGDDAFTDILKDVDIGSEFVHYFVLQTPSMNITTGTPSTYSLIAEVSANAAVMPSGRNILLYRTFSPIWQGKQRQEIDFQYQGPILPTTHRPLDYSQLRKFEKDIVNNDSKIIVNDSLASAHDNYLLKSPPKPIYPKRGPWEKDLPEPDDRKTDLRYQRCDSFESSWLDIAVESRRMSALKAYISLQISLNKSLFLSIIDTAKTKPLEFIPGLAALSSIGSTVQLLNGMFQMAPATSRKIQHAVSAFHRTRAKGQDPLQVAAATISAFANAPEDVRTLKKRNPKALSKLVASEKKLAQTISKVPNKGRKKNKGKAK